LWVSKDAGENWETTKFWETYSNGTMAFAVHASSPNVVIACTFGSGANKLYRSEDYGQTWTETGPEIYSANVHVEKIIPSIKTTGVFYLLGNNFTSHDGVLYESVDEGKTWAKTAFTSNNKAVIDICADKNDNLFIVAANAIPAADLKFTGMVFSGFLYKSADGGSSWNSAVNLNICPSP